MGEDYVGSLLRADANLHYTFSSNTMSLHLNNFEAHYAKFGPATWHDHSFSDWGDFRYDLHAPQAAAQEMASKPSGTRTPRPTIHPAGSVVW